LHKVLSAFQRLLQPAKSTSGNEKKKSEKNRGVFTTYGYLHTKFESIGLTTVVLKGLKPGEAWKPERTLCKNVFA
jgi:hypothetical protein